MTERVRILRVIEYEGPRVWVDQCIANRQVKGTMILHAGTSAEACIREAIIGDTPILLEQGRLQVEEEDNG